MVQWHTLNTTLKAIWIGVYFIIQWFSLSRQQRSWWLPVCTGPWLLNVLSSILSIKNKIKKLKIVNYIKHLMSHDLQTTLGKHLGRYFKIFSHIYLFLSENRVWGLMQNASCFPRKLGQTICMKWQILFSRKIRKHNHFVIYWVCPESAKKLLLVKLLA